MALLSLFMVANGYDKEQIVNRLDEDYRALRNQADALLTQGNAEEAIGYYLKYLGHKRDDYVTLYNTALAFGMLKEPELAGRFLLEAVRNGWDDFEHISEDNKYLANVEKSEAFIKYRNQCEEIIKRVKRTKGEISYIEVPMKIRYRTVLPDNFNSNITYTVLIMMHGYGGNHNNFATLTTGLQESNIIFVAPQATYPFETIITREPSFSWAIFDSEYEKENNNEHNFSLVSSYILKLTEEIKTKYKVDKVFLAGFSQGGFHTLAIGTTNPNIFNGLICFGGGISDDVVDEELALGKATPVLIVHGEQDFVVPYEYGTNAMERLKNAGYDVSLYNFKGGHTVSRDAFEKAINWLRNK